MRAAKYFIGKLPKDTKVGFPNAPVYLEDRDPEKRYEGSSWAITCNGECLSKEDLEFEYEPSPSSRDSDFLNRCRFTYDEATYLLFKLKTLLNIEEI